VARQRVEVGLPLFVHVFDGSLVLLRGCDECLYPAALLLSHGDQRFDLTVVRDDGSGEGVHDPCEPVDFFFCRQSCLFVSVSRGIDLNRKPVNKSIMPSLPLWLRAIPISP
jgi:hypothetical protein